MFIGEGPPASSYLDIGKILEAARTSGADGIHPATASSPSAPSLLKP